MKKSIMLISAFLITVLNLSALDITTKAGKVYKNVEVTNVLPNAIDFIYKKKDGTEVVRGVKLKDLTEDLQKKYKYTPEKAKLFEKRVAKFQAEQAKVAEKHMQERHKLFLEHKKFARELDHIKALLWAHRIVCWLHITRTVGNEDCIARITMPRSSTKFGYLGQGYIYGITGSQNARIGTTIYPTGKTKSFEDGIFPVYESDIEAYALKIHKEHQQKESSTAAPISIKTASTKK